MIQYPIAPILRQAVQQQDTAAVTASDLHQRPSNQTETVLLPEYPYMVTSQQQTQQRDVPSRVLPFSYRDALLKRKPIPMPGLQTERVFHATPSMTSPQVGNVSSISSAENSRKLKRKTREKIDNMLLSTDGTFMFICSKCFRGQMPAMKVKHSKGNFCDSAERHHWEVNKVIVHRSPNTVPVLIRTRPKKLFSHVKAKLCLNGHGCRFGDNCLHAHNPIEVKVWNLGPALVPAYIVERCTVTNVNVATGFCCSYCNKVFQVRWMLEEHVTTQQHLDNISLDKERPWQHREPPTNVIDGTYEMCAR